MLYIVENPCFCIRTIPVFRSFLLEKEVSDGFEEFLGDLPEVRWSTPQNTSSKYGRNAWNSGFGIEGALNQGDAEAH